MTMAPAVERAAGMVSAIRCPISPVRSLQSGDRGVTYRSLWSSSAGVYRERYVIAKKTPRNSITVLYCSASICLLRPHSFFSKEILTAWPRPNQNLNRLGKAQYTRYGSGAHRAPHDGFPLDAHGDALPRARVLPLGRCRTSWSRWRLQRDHERRDKLLQLNRHEQGRLASTATHLDQPSHGAQLFSVVGRIRDRGREQIRLFADDHQRCLLDVLLDDGQQY
mmetsp:Transcript_27332/g.74004  ORF Transcript_27332/g.74004 Transcript_27332/m.74004 type:complete len:222 (-) Transcript_27332:904-1569(-)